MVLLVKHAWIEIDIIDFEEEGNSVNVEWNKVAGLGVKIHCRNEENEGNHVNC